MLDAAYETEQEMREEARVSLLAENSDREITDEDVDRVLDLWHQQTMENYYADSGDDH